MQRDDPMRKLLYAATALVALAAIPAAASAAAVLTAGACVPGSLGTPCAGAQIGAAGAPPIFAFGPTVVGNFSVSGGAVAGVTSSGATFNSQTITVSTTTGGLLNVYVTLSDIATQGLPLLFTSTFTSNQQNATTHEVIESTYLDNSNGLFTHPAAGLLATADLTSAILQVSGPTTIIKTPGALASLTELYQIQLAGCGSQPNGICTANLTIDLNAALVPEPMSIALLGVGLLVLGKIARRKRAA